MLQMTTQNIEDLSAQISAKTFVKILWALGILLLGFSAGYWSLKQDIADLRANQTIRAATTDGKFELINSNLENIKAQFSDVKQDVKDLKSVQPQKLRP